MNSRQVAKLNMYRSVQQLCNDNNSFIAGNPAFLNALTIFNSKIDEIVSTAASENQVIKGITTDKSVAKKNLCQNAVDTASTIFAFASANGNNTLKQVVNFSFSDLNRLKDDVLYPTCMNILNAAKDSAAALVSYGLTPEMITSLGNSMSSYNTAVPTTKTARSVKSTYGGNLKQLVKDTDAVLKDQMDKIMNTFKIANKDFISSYKNARVIIDPKVTPVKPVAPAAAA